MQPSHNKTVLTTHGLLYMLAFGVYLLLVSSLLFTEGSTGIRGMENAVRAKFIVSQSTAEFRTMDLAMDNRDYMPLGYWIEGQLMRLMGDSYLFEKLFSAVMFALSIFLMVRIWILLGKGWRTSWIPVAFLVLSPVMARASTQNLFELPLMVCGMLAFCSFYRVYLYRQKWTRWNAEHPDLPPKDMRLVCISLSCAGGLWLVVCFFIKGFATVYLNLIPFVIWAFGRKDVAGSPWRNVCLTATFSTLIITLLCLFSPLIRQVTWEFLQTKIAIWSHPKIALGNLSLAWYGIRQAGVAYFAMLAVWVYAIINGGYLKRMAYWRHRDELSATEYANIQSAYRFFTIAILGLIPMVMSAQPQDYYVIPLMPWVVLGCACVVNDYVVQLVERSVTAVNVLLSVVAIGALTAGMVLNYNNIAKIGHDTDVVSDLHEMDPYLKDGQVVSVTPEVYDDLKARVYFLRYKSLTFDTLLTHNYLITTLNNLDNISAPVRYKQKKINTTKYHLYEATYMDDWTAGEWSF